MGGRQNSRRSSRTAVPTGSADPPLKEEAEHEEEAEREAEVLAHLRAMALAREQEQQAKGSAFPSTPSSSSGDEGHQGNKGWPQSGNQVGSPGQKVTFSFPPQGVGSVSHPSRGHPAAGSAQPPPNHWEAEAASAAGTPLYLAWSAERPRGEQLTPTVSPVMPKTQPPPGSWTDRAVVGHPSPPPMEQENVYPIRTPDSLAIQRSPYSDVGSGASEKSVMVCRHWKSKGWCRLDSACKFLHPESKRGVGIGQKDPSSPSGGTSSSQASPVQKVNGLPSHSADQGGAASRGAPARRGRGRQSSDLSAGTAPAPFRAGAPAGRAPVPAGPLPGNMF